ncbi:GrpB family protein [Arthrobacter liuii]|uniref:GrpB family protein n=1 Tax=Arthrobacter liuii TaxID=1476996 RepID=A0ABQ2AWR6_9MICC|nr:GrpB family protein [Arthrobacter liuii]GGI00396.1 hypothetical protein GCM10007170_37440 [Arthrobacter liuii]
MTRANAVVEIVPFETGWSDRFLRTRTLLSTVFHGASIEHIGSTSVHGLSSKDTIDVAVGVPDVAAALSPAAVGSLTRLGFEYVPASFAEDPDHAFLQRIIADHRTDHVHVMRLGSNTWIQRLRFRDYLRAHPDAAVRYERAKLELADRFHDDRDGYVQRKQPIVESLMVEARRWAEESR